MSPEPAPAVLSFDAIGAPWQIETRDALAPGLIGGIHARIEAYDATYSRFRAGSLVARLASEPGHWRFPADADVLFAFYRRLYDATAGTVTPLVGRRLEQLGYDRDYSLTPAPVSALAPIPNWDDVMLWDEDTHTLTTREPVVIDFGAAGKGYLVDLVAGMLRDAGIDEFLVDASGDLVQSGTAPVRVALEHPFDPQLAIGVVELQNGALCASAPGRRAWGTGLHHILDGLTGEPTTGIAATWAEAPTGLVADGAATALFFVPGQALADPLPELEYVRMFPTGRVERSPGFAGELFT